MQNALYLQTNTLCIYTITICYTPYILCYTLYIPIHYTLYWYVTSIFTELVWETAFWAHSFSLTEVLYFHGPATLEQLVPRKYGKLPAHGRQPPKRHAQLIGDQARNLNIKWLNGWLFVNLSTICSSAPPQKSQKALGFLFVFWIYQYPRASAVQLWEEDFPLNKLPSLPSFEGCSVTMFSWFHRNNINTILLIVWKYINHCLDIQNLV